MKIDFERVPPFTRILDVCQRAQERQRRTAAFRAIVTKHHDYLLLDIGLVRHKVELSSPPCSHHWLTVKRERLLPELHDLLYR